MTVRHVATSLRDGDRSSWAPAPLPALVAVLTAVVLELMRSSGPLIDHAFARTGVPGATGAGLVTYLAPGLVLALLLGSTRRHPGRTLLVGVGLLVLMRLVAQAVDGLPKFFVGLATVSLGIAVLVVAVSLLAARPCGGRGAASALAAGAGAGVGLQLALGTWDAYWRSGLLGWTVSTALVLALVVSAYATAREPGSPAGTPVRRLWALGPVLALLLMVLANPPFAAAQAGLPLAVAGPVHGGGLLVAAWVVSRATRLPGVVTAVALVAATAALMGLGGRFTGDGLLVLLAVLVAQVAAALGLAQALRPARDSGPPPAREPARAVQPWLAGVAALAGLGAILPPMLYQVAYEIPLGFPNEWILVGAAGVLGLASLGAPPGRDAEPAARPLLPAAVVVVLAGSAVSAAGALTLSSDRAHGADGDARVMVWNIHYAVGSTGALDPEAIARTVERYDPDVVLLNEISSGWVLAGGMDVGTWLSQRLDRQLAFAPAADRQFGSAVLSPWEMADVRVHPLPQGEGSQGRSAVSARVRLGGRPTDVVSVQLQNKAANAPTRVMQGQALLEAIQDMDAVVVGGDLNANPGTEAVELLLGEGLTSAVDAVGDREALTYPATDPEQRIDWVLGRGVRFLEADVLEQETAADHLPILVTVRP
jgi:endonuclease/exonuclease/phosphatase family metal-dependent hydrolase